MKRKKTLSSSAYILIGLVGFMLLVKIFDIAVNPNKTFAGRDAEFAWAELIVTAALGAIGLALYKKAGLPDFLNKDFMNVKAISISAGLGFGFSIVLVIYDSIAKMGDMSVGWPLSVLFYIWGAISTEVIFRLFGISLLVWLFGNLIFKKKHNDRVFMVAAGALSILAMLSMLMAFSMPDVPLHKPGSVMFALLGLIVFSSEMAAFRLVKRYGFLSGLLFRLCFYLVWHIIWPVVFY